MHNRYREPGGEDAVVDEEARLLQAAGHEVISHSVTNPAGALRSAGALGLSPWNPFSARAVTNLIRRHRPDVAHVHNTWYSLTPSVIRAVKQAGVPVVVTVHNYRLFCVNALLLRDGRPCEDCLGHSPWAGVRHRCYQGSAVASAFVATTIAVGRARHVWEDDVDSIIAPSRFLEQKLIESGIAPDKIVVKPHGVEDPGPRHRPPSASRTVFFVGRLSHEKGADTLLQAWAAGHDPDLRLVFLGDGPLREELEGRGIPDVEFRGWQSADEVVQAMLSARALVFPSVCYENLPRAVVEALACGLPVLASNHGGPGELVAGLGPRWAVPPSDVAAWTTGLAVLTEDESVDQAGTTARQLFLEHYTVEAATASLLAIYDDARGAGAGDPRTGASAGGRP